MFASTPTPLPRRPALLTSVALWATLTAAAAMAEPARPWDGGRVSAQADASGLQRALHYERMLGLELAPDMAVCVDSRVGESWSLPTVAAMAPSERFVQRAQRAHEECSGLLLPEPLDQQRRQVSASFRRQFQRQIQARQSQEPTKQAVKDCLQHQEAPAEFQRCLAQSAPGVLTDMSWPRWLTLFELFRKDRAQPGADKPH
jgi:hypothetical protein